MSRNLLIFGTKNNIHTNTTGQAIIKRSNQNRIKLSLKPTFIEIINSDTNVLVKKDIIMANITNLYFFIFTEYHEIQKVVEELNHACFPERKEFWS